MLKRVLEKKHKSGTWLLIERVLKNFGRHALLYLTVIITIMLATSMIMYQKKSKTATVYITLNYEEATKGLYPNKTRFNISLIKSNDVLERAIKKAGLEGITPKQISDNITASAMILGNIQDPVDSASSGYRIATTYTVTYQKNPEIQKISASDMLGLIVEAYKDVFYEHYTYVEVQLTSDWQDCRDQEYLEIGDFFKKESDKISRFIKRRLNENGTFMSSNGETFASLKKKIDNFISIDLEKYNSYVLQSGISKQRERFVNKLDYENYLSNISYQKYISEYNNRLKTIELYDSSLTAVVLIPTLDTDKNFYMSRTKVAIDYQAKEAENANFHANDMLSTIRKNEYTINQMQMAIGAPTGEMLDKAEIMIQEMQKKLMDISEKSEVINKEYIRYKTKNYLTISAEERTMSDILSFKWMLLSGISVFSIICIGIFNSDGQRKKE